MRPQILLVSFLISSLAYGQSPQMEINEQVWKPFIQGFITHDTDLFMSVHSKDVVRSPRDGKQVYGWEEYFQGTLRGNERGKKNPRKTEIVLRFTERIAQNELAMEVGIYETSRISSDGKKQSFYGRFHVVHRKENGVWKILVDTDSSEGKTISEKDFLAAQPME